MSTPGSGDLRLQARVTEPRSTTGEVGQLVLAVHGSDRQRGRRRARRTDRLVLALVAGRNHEQGAGLRGDVVDRLAERVGAVGGLAAEAHVHDLRAFGGGPLHPGDDPGVVAVPVVAEHLADQQVGLRRHALPGAARARAGTGDGRGDVRAVAEVVLGAGRAAGEVLALLDLAVQVRVRRVDAGVQYGDLHAGALVPGLPGVRRADLRDALVEHRTHLAVQPDLGDTAVQRAGAGAGLQRFPQLRQLVLRGGQGAAADRRQMPRRRRTGEVLRGPGAGGVLDDEREARGVAVPVSDQLVDVEQVHVQDAARHERYGVARQYAEPAVGLDRVERDAFAAGRRADRGGLLAGARVGQLDDVTGDQGDRRRLDRGGSRGRGGGGRDHRRRAEGKHRRGGERGGTSGGGHRRNSPSRGLGQAHLFFRLSLQSRHSNPPCPSLPSLRHGATTPGPAPSEA